MKKNPATSSDESKQTHEHTPAEAPKLSEEPNAHAPHEEHHHEGHHDEHHEEHHEGHHDTHHEAHHDGEHEHHREDHQHPAPSQPPHDTPHPTTPTVAQPYVKPPKPHKPHQGFRVATILGLVLALGLGGTALGFSLYNFLKDATPITFNYGGSDGNSAQIVSGSIADVANHVSPAVVSIITETRTMAWYGQSTSTSAGTGMIVTKDGYVITNKHVVSGARNISVILDNGTTFSKVKVVGTDPFNDVAYLKISDASDLPTVKLGDSKTLIAGQQVIAIGNALGQYQNSITAGIISGIGRSITASDGGSMVEQLTDMIQTDAAINPGNSGGPLVNAAGEVIGINTATNTDADNMGFAIPISSVKGMLKDLTSNGTASRAYLGVYSVNLTPDSAKSYDLDTTAGAYLYQGTGTKEAVLKDSPAEKAGLKANDIITKVNGIAIGKAGSLTTLIGEYAPGDTVQLTIIRDGKESAVNVTLGSYDDQK